MQSQSQWIIPLACQALEEQPARITLPYTWVGHIPFAFSLIKLARPRLLVELGTHSGNSFCAFCQAVHAHAIQCNCVAVDSWEGDLHAGFYDIEVYSSLADYVANNYGHFARLHRGYFDDAVNTFQDGTIDLLHIDGLHTYEAVKHDFETWLPKLSNRAVVLFHDTNVYEREFGVHQFWAEMIDSFSGFAFTHSHGLGVLLVGEDVPQDIREFVKQANLQDSLTRRVFSAVALAMLPLAAAAYVRHLQYQEDLAKLPRTILLEAFDSMTQSFEESRRQFRQIEFYPEHIGKPMSVRFPIPPDTRQLRIDFGFEPIILDPAISALIVLLDGTEIRITAHQTNHCATGDKGLIFGDDPQALFTIPDEASFICVFFVVNQVGLEVLNELPRRLVMVNSDLNWYRKELPRHAAAQQELIDKCNRLGEELNLFKADNNITRQEVINCKDQLRKCGNERDQISANLRTLSLSWPVRLAKYLHFIN